jgi:putative transposase
LAHINKPALRPSLESAQDPAVRYTERPDQAGAVASVGSRGDSNDCALTESFNSPYKTALVCQRGPCRGLGDVELDTLEWVDWFNQRRLHAELDTASPAEVEADHYHVEAPALPAVSQYSESA